jgi:hypothetical protein
MNDRSGIRKFPPTAGTFCSNPTHVHSTKVAQFLNPLAKCEVEMKKKRGFRLNPIGSHYTQFTGILPLTNLTVFQLGNFFLTSTRLTLNEEKKISKC